VIRELSGKGLALMLAACVLSIGIGCQKAEATGIPTVDIAATLQRIQQIQNGIDVLENAQKLLKQGQQLVEQGERQYKSISGVRDMGNLLNSQLYRENRKYLPKNWRDTLTLAKGVADGRYSTLSGAGRALAQANRIYERSQLGEGQRAPGVRRLTRDEDQIASIQASSGATYERSAQRVEELQALVDKVNQTEDLKASMDLVARMQAEQLFLLNELIQVQARGELSKSQDTVVANQRAEERIYAARKVYTGAEMLSDQTE
jgi:type IV secretion system protein VirB5